jgi:hypothetical protein
MTGGIGRNRVSLMRVSTDPEVVARKLKFGKLTPMRSRASRRRPLHPALA